MSTQIMKELIENNDNMFKALTEISNMCIGEITMSYRLDANAIGELIYQATGNTNPELNEAVRHMDQEPYPVVSL